MFLMYNKVKYELRYMKYVKNWVDNSEKNISENLDVKNNSRFIVILCEINSKSRIRSNTRQCFF